MSILIKVIRIVRDHKLLTFSVIYIAASCVMVLHRMSLAPDQAFVVLLVVSVILGIGIKFIKDWFIPTFLIILYDYLRGVLEPIAELPHLNPMVNFSRKLFGSTLVGRIQTLFQVGTNLRWYDYFFTVVYMCHFIIPFFVGYIFWIKDRRLFLGFIYSLVVLSYLGLITFFLFPTMPPWYAANFGYIRPVTKLYDLVTVTFPEGFYVPSVYQFIGTNQFAALPSLHIAYPWVVSIYLAKFSKKLLPVLFIFMILEIFTVIYLGEHYILDAFVGIVYGGVAFFLVEESSKFKLFQKKFNVFRIAKNSISKLAGMSKILSAFSKKGT